MNLTEKIIKGITEIEFEINPELLKDQPDKGKKSTSHVMSYLQDYAKMGVIKIYAGPKVEFPGDMKKYDVASDSNMFADLHDRIQKSHLWWSWYDDERRFVLKPGFDTLAPGFWAIVLDLMDYYYDTYVARPKGTDDPQNIPGFNDDDDDDDDDEGVVIGEPKVSVYNRENGGHNWEFSSEHGYNVSGRLLDNDLVIDAASSTVFLTWYPYGKVKQVFEWFDMNLPPGTSIIVNKVERKEYPVVKRLQRDGLIDAFNMRNEE